MWLASGHQVVQGCKCSSPMTGCGLQPITMVEGEQPLGPRTYSVTVETGTVKGAGTSSSVSIVLVGVEGRQLGPRLLEASIQDFERGRKDTFQLIAASAGENIGAVQSV